MPRTPPRPAPLRRAHGPLRRALLAVLRRTRSRRTDANDTTIRILLMHAWGMGGTIRTVLTLAGELAERHEVEVLSIVRRRDEPRFPFPPGVTVSAIDDQRPWARRPLPARAAHAVLSRLPGLLLDRRDRGAQATTLWTDVCLTRRLRGLRGGLLMGTRPGLNLLVLDLAGPGVATVGQEHMHLARHGGSMQATIIKRYPRLDAVVTLTEADRSDYERRLAEPTRVRRIPNAVPDLRGAVADPSARTVIAAGRLTPQKGFDLLIDAWVPVAAEHPDWTLRICGGGSKQAALERRVRRHGLEGRVVLPGIVDLGAAMSRASVFVLSSRFEGLPMALLEAMGAGMAVVSFDCPTGPRELLEDGRDGLLVPPEDRAALSAALLTVIGDEDLRRHLGAAAHERSAAFAPAVVLDRWETLFDELATVRRQVRGTPGPRPDAPLVLREPVVGGPPGRAAPR